MISDFVVRSNRLSESVCLCRLAALLSAGKQRIKRSLAWRCSLLSSPNLITPIDKHSRRQSTTIFLIGQVAAQIVNANVSRNNFISIYLLISDCHSAPVPCNQSPDAEAAVSWPDLDLDVTHCSRRETLRETLTHGLIVRRFLMLCGRFSHHHRPGSKQTNTPTGHCCRVISNARSRLRSVQRG